MKRISPLKAKKKVKKKKEFYEHLNAYIGVNLFLFLLNAVTAFGHWWFIWPLMGWGIGLFFHYLDVFGMPFTGVLDEDWEERQLRRELGREQEDQLDLEELKQREAAERGSGGGQPTWKDEDLV